MRKHISNYIEFELSHCILKRYYYHGDERISWQHPDNHCIIATNISDIQFRHLSPYIMNQVSAMIGKNKRDTELIIHEWIAEYVTKVRPILLEMKHGNHPFLYSYGTPT